MTSASGWGTNTAIATSDQTPHTSQMPTDESPADTTARGNNAVDSHATRIAFVTPASYEGRHHDEPATPEG